MVFNPTADPITFLVFYFMFVVPAEGIVGILKIALITSVFIYPFVLVAKRALPKFEQKYPYNYIIITFLMFLLFWLISRIYAVVASGSSFFTADLLGFILALIVGTIIASLFVFLGKFMYEKMGERWKMPEPLALYLVTFIICIVFWIIAKILINLIYFGEVAL